MEGERKPVDLAASLGVEWGKCWGGRWLIISTRGHVGPQKQLFVYPGIGGASRGSREPLHQPQDMTLQREDGVDV